MKYFLSIVFLLILSTQIVFANDEADFLDENKDINSFISPDFKLCAQITSIQNSDNPEEGYDIVKILEKNHEIAEYSLAHNFEEMSRYVHSVKWSQDSKYFIFLTKEFFHSMWHSPTYIYVSKYNNFYNLDKYCGDVTCESFSLLNNDHLVISIINKKRTNIYSIKLNISLSHLEQEFNEKKEQKGERVPR